MPAPDVEALLAAMVEQMRPAITPETALVGIHTGGVWLAERLHASLALLPPLGTLDVSFYRDDYGRIGLHAGLRRSNIPFEVDARHIVVVDDVLHTGRTIRAAMNELFDYGRPASIRLAALVDRGGRELPLCAQFVGARLDVDTNEHIELKRDSAGRLSLDINRAPGKARTS